MTAPYERMARAPTAIDRESARASHAAANRLCMATAAADVRHRAKSAVAVVAIAISDDANRAACCANSPEHRIKVIAEAPTGHADVVHHVAAFLFAAGSVHAGDGELGFWQSGPAIRMEFLRPTAVLIRCGVT